MFCLFQEDKKEKRDKRGNLNVSKMLQISSFPLQTQSKYHWQREGQERLRLQ